jgi:hypothetical protein
MLTANPAHLNLRDLITRMIFNNNKKSRTLLVPLSPKYLSQHTLLENLHPPSRTSDSVRDQVPHPCKTTGKTLFLLILIFIIIDGIQKGERF